jgi:hypothetical protein
MDGEQGNSAGELKARLEKVERQVRWVKAAGVVVVLLVSAVVMTEALPIVWTENGVE